MLATRCRDRCPATGADHVGWPAVVVVGSNTVTMATAVTATMTNTITNAITNTVTTSITTGITITVAATVAVATSVATTSSSTAAPAAGSTAPSATTPTVREDRGCRQGGQHQSEHEHSESCHVAAPP